MDRLQGPINPCFLGEQMNVECLEQGNALDISYGSSLENMRFAEPFGSMPFLQMLGVESPTILPEPNLQLLLRLHQQKKPWKANFFSETDSRIPTLELESCITHSESHSPAKSETKEHQCPQSSCLEVASSACNRESESIENCKVGNCGSSSIWVRNQAATKFDKPTPLREKKKRKRTRPCKNSQEVESQRMTHIAVERNRRKQMNDHINALRSIMPSSFIQRGDQASIIGGAIDFVKELEQLLQSLQAQKRMRQIDEGYSPDSSTPCDGFFISPQYTSYTSSRPSDFNYLLDGYIDSNDEFTAENKSAVADIEVTVIQTHVNLKVLSPRRPGQLLKAIAALEDLELAILHLNVTSLECSVLYSFNLKIDEKCKLASADEIATAVHQIFGFINSS